MSILKANRCNNHGNPRPDAPWHCDCDSGRYGKFCNYTNEVDGCRDRHSDSSTYIYKQGNQYSKESITHGLGWCRNSSDKLNVNQYCGRAGASNTPNVNSRNKCNNNGICSWKFYSRTALLCTCKRETIQQRIVVRRE